MEVKLSKDQLETFGKGVQKPTVMKVIDKTSPWFEQFQIKYDGEHGDPIIGAYLIVSSQK